MVCFQVEHSINTEVQCLRKEIASALEEKESYKTQLDGQRRESKHWRQVKLNTTYF